MKKAILIVSIALATVFLITLQAPKSAYAGTSWLNKCFKVTFGGNSYFYEIQNGIQRPEGPFTEFELYDTTNSNILSLSSSFTFNTDNSVDLSTGSFVTNLQNGGSFIDLPGLFGLTGQWTFDGVDGTLEVNDTLSTTFRFNGLFGVNSSTGAAQQGGDLVPEPATIISSLLGLAGLALRKFRKA